MLCNFISGNTGTIQGWFRWPTFGRATGKISHCTVKLIRDDKRTSGLSSMMSPAVKNVSDEDISAIAAYLSGL